MDIDNPVHTMNKIRCKGVLSLKYIGQCKDLDFKARINRMFHYEFP